MVMNADRPLTVDRPRIHALTDSIDMPDVAETHLSQLSTHWSVFYSAHQGSPEQQLQARRQLLAAYEPAVRSYLMASIRDAEAAEELYHEYVVRLMRGDFHDIAPEKGRFRSYLKTVLYHLIVDYRRRRARWNHYVNLEAVPEPATEPAEELPDDERQFLARWKETLLARAQSALDAQEVVGALPLGRVFRLRTQHLDWSDDDLARRLADELGRFIEPGTFRRWLHLARRRFTDALVAEVAWTLENPNIDVLADELEILGFLDRCRAALARRNRNTEDGEQTTENSNGRVTNT